MPKSVTLIKAFIASPNDTINERNVCDKIVSEINIVNGNIQNYRVELIRWERNVYPSVNDNPQQVINSQINFDYDIFIGIMWHKFGEKTYDYQSGTEEEFELAYARFKEGKIAKVMFYFNNSAIPIKDINTDQINKINNFKQSLGQKGLLYWEYTDASEFENFFRIHFSKCIQDLLKSEKKDAQSQQVISSVETDELKIIESEDTGLFEHIENAEINFAELREISDRITSIVSDLTNKFNIRTEEINNHQKTDNKGIQRLVNKTAMDMIDFETRLRPEIPIFSIKYATAFEHYSKALTLSFEINNNLDSYNDILPTVISLKEVLLTTDQSMHTFQKAVERIPGLTTQFNHAKKRTINVLKSLRNEYKISIDTIDEFIKQTNDLKKEDEN